jgi:hypothetical protein
MKLPTMRWRRPQRDTDVMTAATVAVMRQYDEAGQLDEFFALMDQQGVGDDARDLWNRDRLRSQGVDCLDCGGEGPCEACGTMPDQLPRSGYDDPEEDGLVRWWNGEEWIGGPTDPVHVIGSDYDFADDAGYSRYVGA